METIDILFLTYLFGMQYRFFSYQIQQNLINCLFKKSNLKAVVNKIKETIYVHVSSAYIVYFNTIASALSIKLTNFNMQMSLLIFFRVTWGPRTPCDRRARGC